MANRKQNYKVSNLASSRKNSGPRFSPVAPTSAAGLEEKFAGGATAGLEQIPQARR